MNQISTSSPSAMANFEQFVDENPSKAGIQFLRFNKFGVWTYGQEGAQVLEEDRFVAQMNTMSQGWICWKGGRPVDEKMSTISSGVRIPAAELDDHGPYQSSSEGWKPQVSVMFRNLDNNELLQYGTTSMGGKNALKGLSSTFVNQLRDGGDNFPVVQLETDHYMHKTNGKIFVPVVKVVDWINPDTGALESQEKSKPEVVVEDNVIENVIEGEVIQKKRRKVTV